MSWGLWVHASDVAKEGLHALLDEVANVGKACTTSDINVLDFMERAHAEGTSIWRANICILVRPMHLKIWGLTAHFL